ncbi:hypothetical protein FIBSPDRAFT_461795 [Athelia psychrophila]|uniref:Uncharacterized protein n=1 Tax=Athelia psychrophila TaxID=1759441 RepID=A0A166LW68_9AGAM|nr:hypothetical protein FIBSPDRAFT_461795 [Fibularhizoctonia sp. CBS 109695]
MRKYVCIYPISVLTPALPLTAALPYPTVQELPRALKVCGRFLKMLYTRPCPLRGGTYPPPSQSLFLSSNCYTPARRAPQTQPIHNTSYVYPPSILDPHVAIRWSVSLLWGVVCWQTPLFHHLSSVVYCINSSIPKYIIHMYVYNYKYIFCSPNGPELT